MAEVVSLEIANKIAIIYIDNPPLNVTSQKVRQGLLDAIGKIKTNDIERIIITGRGKAFVAGADTKEFDTAPIEPHLPDIIKEIENLNIPTIAVINGVALGGGLEITLGCQYRIASPNAKLGLPEVTLGIIPGAGGTQRLPRLIGYENSLELISEGKTIDAKTALSLGLIDGIYDDILTAAKELEVSSSKPKAKDLKTIGYTPELTQEFIAKVSKKCRGQNAPLIAINMVEIAANTDFEDGLAVERENFLKLKTAPQAAALRNIFFAEREVLGRKTPDGTKQIPEGTKQINEVAIIGGGNMGAAIAYTLAAIGIKVSVIETTEEASKRAFGNVEKLYTEAIKRNKISHDDAYNDLKEKFKFSYSFSMAKNADLVIEAVFEDLAVKQELFAKLDNICNKDTIFATNTSYLDVNKIFENIENPSRTIGLHFFAPAHIMKLLEVVRTNHISDETINTAFALAKRLGKTAIEAGVCDGFIGNRILTRYRQTTDIMLLEGALPWQIDNAMTDFGFAMGPYRVQDLSGLEIAYANRKRQRLKEKPDFRYIHIADKMVEELNRLGQKNNQGWYDYKDGKNTPSEAVENLIINCSQDAKINRREFTQNEIQNIALLAIIEEALKILEEGIAKKPSDIDLVMVHGYGFPRYIGGPLQYATTLGFENILHQIEDLEQSDNKSWSIPQILRDLASGKATIKQLNQKVEK